MFKEILSNAECNCNRRKHIWFERKWMDLVNYSPIFTNAKKEITQQIVLMINKLKFVNVPKWTKNEEFHPVIVLKYDVFLSLHFRSTTIYKSFVVKYLCNLFGFYDDNFSCITLISFLSFAMLSCRLKIHFIYCSSYNRLWFVFFCLESWDLHWINERYDQRVGLLYVCVNTVNAFFYCFLFLASAMALARSVCYILNIHKYALLRIHARIPKKNHTFLSCSLRTMNDI